VSQPALAVAAMVLAFVGSWAAPTSGEGSSRLEFEHEAMGTRFRLVVVDHDEARARAAAERAFRRVDQLDESLSDNRFESDHRKLERSPIGMQVAVPDDLWEVLAEAQLIATATDGAFDVTVGALTRLWRWAARRQTEPSAERLLAARQTVGYRALELDETTRSVTIRRSGLRLDLGGIAKGYAVDEAFETLRAAGLRSILVDGGGDLRLGAPPPGSRGWRVAVPTHGTGPGDALSWRSVLLSDISIATSGATYRSTGPDGRSHVLNPRSGVGIRGDRIVTVMSKSASRADALASALSVLGPGGISVARDLGAIEAVVVDATDSPTERGETNGP
jgi:thiamine biosynthesis lipoprotein